MRPAFSIRNNILIFNATVLFTDTTVMRTTLTLTTSRDGIIDPGGGVSLSVTQPGITGSVEISGAIRSLNRF